MAPDAAPQGSPDQPPFPQPGQQQPPSLSQQPQQRGAPHPAPPPRPPRRVHVRLNVHYRVHSRQMLCVAGSSFPFGWSFLSISKVPMTWNQGDVWTVEVDFPAGERVEYKYVILEEQDWTKLEDASSEGVVEVNYRTSSDSGKPPDVQVIQKQMAIVAWQPGPNRVVEVPSEAELEELGPGDEVSREPARVGPRMPSSSSGGSSSSSSDSGGTFGSGGSSYGGPRPLSPVGAGGAGPGPGGASPPPRDPFEGTWEVLSLPEEGGGQPQQPFLDRHDVWGWAGSSSGGPDSNPLKGLRFDDL